VSNNRFLISKTKIRNQKEMTKEIAEIENENSQLMVGLRKDIEILKIKKSSIKEIGKDEGFLFINRNENRAAQ
jgi:hypothetical protein